MTKTKLDWISTAETLPVDDRWMLTYEPTENEPFEVARYVAELERWLATDGFMLELVTHWRPLPDAPIALDKPPAPVV